MVSAAAVDVSAEVVESDGTSDGALPQAVSARIRDRSRREVMFRSFIIVSFHCVPGADGVPSAVQAVRIFLTQIRYLYKYFITIWN